MDSRTRFVLAGAIITALALPFGVRADDDTLDRDIDHDRAQIHEDQKGIQKDYQKLNEERREGDRPEAKAIERDIRKDERQLKRDEKDLHGDQHVRRYEDREDDAD
jgi:hypothetical protein